MAGLRLKRRIPPYLDRLAGSGLYGLVDPIRPGEIPNTHSGCGTLFGVLPSEVGRLNAARSRQPAPAAPCSPVKLALRANFATLEKTRQAD